MSRIPQNFLDDLLQRVDIVEVIDGRVKLKKTGKNYSACCPFHKEKTPSFTVSPDKQFYYCFGCGATGTAISFLMEYDHLGFTDAVETLARSAGVQVPKESNDSPRPKVHNNLYSLLSKASDYYQDQLKNHPNRQLAVSYLKQRGLDGAIAKAFGLGYAPPGWDNLLVKLGLNEEDRKLLVDSGMVIVNDDSSKRYDRFRQRIMFPILDTRGRTIGFGGRTLDTDATNKGRSGPKYLNSPETPVFHKGRELYGLYQARQANRQLHRLLVVEGYMDVIALAQFSIRYAVATLGTACGADHLSLAFRYTSEIVFCFDGDNAGRKAAKRALENALPTMSDGRQVRFLFLPEGQDPDTLVRQIGQERFEAQIESATPLETFFFESVAEGIDLRTMEGRARMSKLAAPLLYQLPEGIFRELMFNSLAQRTGLSMDVLQELMQAPVKPLAPPEPSSAPAVPIEAPTQPRQQHILQAPPQLEQGTSSRPSARRAAPRRVRLNPARIAASLLLENPELAHRHPELRLPDSADPDLECLRRLVNFLQSRPQASFHTILGYWGGQFGLEAQKELTELVANQFLGSVKRTAPYDGERELSDALQRIQQEAQLRKQQAELSQLSSLPQLDETQKQRLRELLLLTAQTRIQHRQKMDS